MGHYTVSGESPDETRRDKARERETVASLTRAGFCGKKRNEPNCGNCAACLLKQKRLIRGTGLPYRFGRKKPLPTTSDKPLPTVAPERARILAPVKGNRDRTQGNPRFNRASVVRIGSLETSKGNVIKPVSILETVVYTGHGARNADTTPDRNYDRDVASAQAHERMERAAGISGNRNVSDTSESEWARAKRIARSM